ncbi:hypothetical protein ACFL6T_03175 [Candidatus Zixiibacteriota bacterium]
MNRRIATRVIPGLLLVTMVLGGCCNENFKGLGTVSGTLTINGIWAIGEVNALSVQTVDGCDNKYVHFAARDDVLGAVYAELLANGTYTTDLDPQEVIAGTTLTRWMVRTTGMFQNTFDTRWSSEYKLKKNGEKVLTITYTFPELGSH